MMRKYNLVDEEGYTWCLSKGVAMSKDKKHKIRNFGYWGHRRFTSNEEEWEKVKVDYFYFSAKFQQFLMKLEGVKAKVVNSL